MKRFLLLILAYGLIGNSLAQKLPIDTNAFHKWPSIFSPQLTDDGKYSMYTVLDNMSHFDTLNIISNSTNWRIKIPGLHRNTEKFSKNGKTAYYQNTNDSLAIVTLGSSSVKYISNVLSYLLLDNGNQQWLAFRVDTNSKILFIRNVSTSATITIQSVLNYWSSKNGNILIIRTASQNDPANPQCLNWLNLTTGKITRFWQGFTSSQFTFDNDCKQLAFIEETKDARTTAYSILYFRDGMDYAETLMSEKSHQLRKELAIANRRLQFSKYGDKLLFALKSKAVPSESPSPKVSVNVYIWNYKDKYLQSEQLSPGFSEFNSTTYWATLNIVNKKVIYLNEEGQDLTYPDTFQNFLLISDKELRTAYYDTIQTAYYYVVSTDDGRRSRINRTFFSSPPRLSPKEDFVLWFDPDSLNYFAYETGTGLIRNISNQIPVPLYDSDAFHMGKKTGICLDIAAWGFNDHSVYLYSAFDIWKVDLKASIPSINITNGFGNKHQIVFSILNSHDSGPDKLIAQNETILLSAYEMSTKFNGFWELSPGFPKDPVMRTMQPCVFWIARTAPVRPHASGNYLVKAKSANTYIVQRMTAESFPNLYVTSDFVSYKQISALYPEKAFNWLTSKLITWTMLDGIQTQGVLYIPQNFDTTKKYPIIFNYYNQASDLLYQYFTPAYSSSDLNIPYYVSNGYLICTPDIHYKQNHNGKSVVNALVSAANYLSKFSWVDSTKMGLQGHSYGGTETNYLVTHSTQFAAACTAAGVSDEVSDYDGDNGYANGDILHSYYELQSNGSPYQLGFTPWARPDLYIENSAIFSIDKVITPLLLVHGDHDGAVPFGQATEMFLALRRAGKRVWLLQYANTGHAYSGLNSIDYSIRMKQFFDYYLKGTLPPKWMTEGIAASQERINTGLELDSSGKIP